MTRDKKIIAFKTVAGRVYHLPCTMYKGIPNFWSLCNRDISEAPLPGRKFGNLTDKNICRQCATKRQETK